MFEAFREEDDLSDELVVWFGHCHRSEELLEVVRKFGPTSVTFPSWVHCDEDPRIRVNLNLTKNI